MTGLTGLGWQIHDHLKAHRPKMFQGLKKNRTLNQYILDRQNKLNNSLTVLEHQGLRPHEAEEMMLDQIYLPSEEDVPRLGETKQPYTD